MKKGVWLDERDFEIQKTPEESKEVLKENEFYLIFKAKSWNLKQISVCSKGKYLNIFRNSSRP